MFSLDNALVHCHSLRLGWSCPISTVFEPYRGASTGEGEGEGTLLRGRGALEGRSQGEVYSAKSAVEVWNREKARGSVDMLLDQT